MSDHPTVKFFPLCDLHHSPMRRVMIEEAGSEGSQSFHQCERRDCSRIFCEPQGYLDFADGRFDESRVSSRVCPECGGTLYISEADDTLKTETWECAEVSCAYSEDIPSPSSR